MTQLRRDLHRHPELGFDEMCTRKIIATRLRKRAPAAGAVVSVTEFLTDGQRNVLPGKAVLKGDFRARSADDRARIAQFIQQIADGIGSAHGVGVSVAFDTQFVETINAGGPTEAAYRTAETAGCTLVRNRLAMRFSEDFAHFAAAVPGCFLLLGNGETGRHGRPLHASECDFNDDLSAIGAGFWVQLVQDRLPLRKEQP
ncbi:hypothetical protein [Roseobacter sp. MH60115]|uniref:hypothetical protein n=1 Tax=Roseobacter sp. MH60115 TaxID=2785324 RepID=UPI0018A2816E|nr:hypothetical protein [Roseobacter sp. MH60115]